MRIDDGAEFSRHFEAAHQRRRGIRRHCEDDGVVRRRARSVVAAEIQRLDPLGAETERAK